MKFQTEPSPHVLSPDATQRIMGRVLLALSPIVLSGIIHFGFRAILLLVSGVGAALVGEAAWNAATGRHPTLEDNSAAVTGALLALSLPPSAPYWLAALGSLFAVVVTKGMGGGLGQNRFNPALAARAMLLLLFPVEMTRYPIPGPWLPIWDVADVVTAATPLHQMRMPALPDFSLWELFFGFIGGSIGEVCSLSVLLGGGYLLWKGVISPRILLSYLGTAALLFLLFPQGQQPVLWMLCQLLSGSLLFGAFFFATDYSSSPVTPRGQLLYGVGCGGLTVLFRTVGLYPEGVTYAILLMNAAMRWLERWTAPRRFGQQKGAAS